MTFTKTLFKKWPDTTFDLSFFLCPTKRFPLRNKITKRLHPFIRRNLLPPKIQQVHSAGVVHPYHKMHRIVTSTFGNGIVTCPVDVQGITVGAFPTGPRLQPVTLEEITCVWRRALLVKCRPGTGLPFEGLKMILREPFWPNALTNLAA